MKYCHLQVMLLRYCSTTSHGGGMVYATDSKSVSRKGLRVRVPPVVPKKDLILGLFLLFFFNKIARHVNVAQSDLLSVFLGIR